MTNHSWPSFFIISIMKHPSKWEFDTFNCIFLPSITNPLIDMWYSLCSLAVDFLTLWFTQTFLFWQRAVKRITCFYFNTFLESECENFAIFMNICVQNKNRWMKIARFDLKFINSPLIIIIDDDIRLIARYGNWYWIKIKVVKYCMNECTTRRN